MLRKRVVFCVNSAVAYPYGAPWMYPVCFSGLCSLAICMHLLFAIKNCDKLLFNVGMNWSQVSNFYV